jgi:hypothetical protein
VQAGYWNFSTISLVFLPHKLYSLASIWLENILWLVKLDVLGDFSLKVMLVKTQPAKALSLHKASFDVQIMKISRAVQAWRDYEKVSRGK